MSGSRLVSRSMATAVHVLGLAAFAWPFLTGPSATSETGAHAADAAWLFTALGTVLIGVALADLRAGRTDAKQIALLGVLAAMNAALRLPGSLGGASLMFMLPILAGYVFGPRFGFMLGATSFAASAVITGGVGPWLPFQMWALGWIGAGAGVIGRRARPVGTSTVIVLAGYGWLAGFAFGAVMNLWSWPFTPGQSPLAWQPGLGPGETVARYARFYLVTSFAWDAGRALGNAVLIGALGRPVLRLMTRFKDRSATEWLPADASAVPAR